VDARCPAYFAQRSPLASRHQQNGNGLVADGRGVLENCYRYM
jgi:hypothetical protein